MWRCCIRLCTGFMIMSHCTGVDRKHQLIGSNQREKLPRRDAGQGHVLVQKRANRCGSATTKKSCAARLLYAHASSISAGLQAEG